MLMKDGLGQEAISRISSVLSAVHEEFPKATFEAQAMKGLAPLELKERVRHLIRVLHDCLPQPYSRVADLLINVPKHWDFGRDEDPISGFAAWPLIDYVGEYGLEAPKKSLKVLEKVTHLFSAEFAIRPFLIHHEAACFAVFEKWVDHKNHHVRRLVSEGCRPRLPWGIRLQAYVENPKPILPWLEALRLDETDYVRRSVANNLNDIAKDHPELVIQICKRWQKRDKGKSDWVIRHALRTLVKQGHPEVFALLGYSESPEVTVGEIALSSASIKLGGELTFSVDIHAAQHDVRCVVDYGVHYVKANGKRAPKIYKLKNCELAKGETLQLSKRVSFKPISTRRFYVGEHLLTVQVNGVEQARTSFMVK